MNKFTMELVWHSCNDYLPEENYNACLYVTDGTSIWRAKWKRNSDEQYFYDGSWHIQPNINADGFWWADIVQTIGEEQRFKK
jgi:hypothetical protein